MRFGGCLVIYFRAMRCEQNPVTAKLFLTNTKPAVQSLFKTSMQENSTRFLALIDVFEESSINDVEEELLPQVTKHVRTPVFAEEGTGIVGAIPKFSSELFVAAITKEALKSPRLEATAAASSTGDRLGKRNNADRGRGSGSPDLELDVDQFIASVTTAALSSPRVSARHAAVAVVSSATHSALNSPRLQETQEQET